MDNKTIARNFYEAISAGKLDIIDEVVAENFVEHEEFPGLASGRDGLRQFFQMIRGGEFAVTRRRAAPAPSIHPSSCG